MLLSRLALAVAITCALATGAAAQKLQPSTGIMLVAPTDGTGAPCTTANPCPVSGGGGGGGVSEATAGASPPSYSAGAQNMSQTLSGGLRVQLNIAGTDIGLGQQAAASSLPVVDAGDYAQGSTTSGQLGPLMMGAVLTASPTYSTTQTSPLVMDTSGNLHVGWYLGSSALAHNIQAAATPPAGINIGGIYLATKPTLTNTQGIGLQQDIKGNLLTTPGPTSDAGSAIAPVVSAALESSHILKGSAGNLYEVTVADASATAGFLEVFNATTAPADGAVTPQECRAVAGTGSTTIQWSGPPESFSTGITAVLSSATNCFTKTTGVITGFFHGMVQ